MEYLNEYFILQGLPLDTEINMDFRGGDLYVYFFKGKSKFGLVVKASGGELTPVITNGH